MGRFNFQINAIIKINNTANMLQTITPQHPPNQEVNKRIKTEEVVASISNNTGTQSNSDKIPESVIVIDDDFFTCSEYNKYFSQ